MNRWMLSMLVASTVGWLPASAHAQGTKMARGIVRGFADGSIVVNVHDQKMTFTVDDKTEAIPEEGTRRTAATQKSGAKPRVSDVFHAGQSVEIAYHDMNGMMHAASVRAVGPATSATSASPTKRASGTVTAVTGDSLTVSTGDGNMTFVVDTSTHFSAPGASTKSAQVAGKLTMTDAVKTGDRVSVGYHETDGKMHASDVRVSGRAK